MSRRRETSTSITGKPHIFSNFDGPSGLSFFRGTREANRGFLTCVPAPLCADMTTARGLLAVFLVFAEIVTMAAGSLDGRV